MAAAVRVSARVLMRRTIVTERHTAALARSVNPVLANLDALFALSSLRGLARGNCAEVIA